MPFDVPMVVFIIECMVNVSSYYWIDFSFSTDWKSLEISIILPKRNRYYKHIERGEKKKKDFPEENTYVSDDNWKITFSDQ